MAADALSEVLRTVRLTGATYFNVVGKAPWVAEQPTREMVLPKVLPGAEHLIAYHVITEGRCFAGSSRAGESHPRALTEPYVNLSAHTALVAQPDPRRKDQCANSRGRA